MENANVRLSASEHELVQDANVILTKNAIIEKVKTLLAAVSEPAQQRFAGSFFLFGLPLQTPRITRGENYKGLPWVAMDCPRIFKQEGISAMRCIFWWGHHFTCTWHCSGIYKDRVLEKVIAGFEYFAAHGWMLYTGDDEWTHELTNRHKPVSLFNQHEFEQALLQRHFFKLCKFHPLSQWGETAAFYDGCFEEMINIPG